MLLGVALAALDTTVIVTLAAPISISLGNFSLISWVASAYIIANAACQPLLGKVTDIYGRRGGLIVSNLLFAGGNLLCGLATHPSVLILGRVVAGLGGGGMTAICNFVNSDLVPLRQRGLISGISNLIFGVGNALGGLFGGFMNDTLSWRSAFLIQVPFCLLSTVLVSFLPGIPSKKSDQFNLSQVDFLGALTLTASLVLLLLGLNLGSGSLGFRHPLVIVFLALTPCFLCLFVWNEHRWAKAPIIPFQVLTKMTVVMADLNTWFTMMAVFAVLVYLPVWFQLRGRSATAAGAQLIAQSIGLSVGSLLAGFLTQRTGKYVVLGIGLMAIFVLGNGILLTLGLSSNAWPATISLAMIGLGYGGIITVNLVANISSPSHEFHAVVTSCNVVFRSTGAAIGVNMASAVYESVLRMDLQHQLSSENGGIIDVGNIVDNIDKVNEFPPEWREVILNSCMKGVHSVFITCLVLSGLAFFCQLFVKQHKLHSNLERK